MRKKNRGSAPPARPVTRGLPWWWAPVIGAIFTLAAFGFLRRYEDRDARDGFTRAAVERLDRLDSSIELSLNDLMVLGAYYDAASNIDRATFQRLTRPLLGQVSPIQALEWIPRVADAQRMRFIRSAQREGYTDFDFVRRSQRGAMVPEGRRSEYFPVYFLDPLRGNERALGFDLASDPVRRAALERSAASRRMLATGRITLVQGNPDQYGFLVFRPVFRAGAGPLAGSLHPAGLTGFVLAVFRIGDIIESGDRKGRSQVRLVLFDDDAAPGSHLLYPKGLKIDAAGALPGGFRMSREIPVGGRTWTAVALPVPGAFVPKRNTSNAVLLLGLLSTLLWSLNLKQRNKRMSDIECAVEQRTLELSREHVRLQTIFATASDGIHILDGDGVLVEANRAFLTMLGYDESAIGRLRVTDWNTQDSWEEIKARIDHFMSLSGQSIFQTRHYRRDGVAVDVEITASMLEIEGRRYLYAASRDITERKRAEEKLHLAANVFTHAREGIMITAADGRIVDVNDAFVRITGYRREEVLGKNPNILSSGRQDQEFYAAMWRDLTEKDHWSGEIWNRRKNGEVYAEMLTISAVRDDAGNVQQYVALFSDITSFKEQERQLEHIAHYDALTSLPNRVLLSDRLHQAMVQTLRRGQRLAVVYLDLDGFKEVNDGHGHSAGDQLLMAVATRMKQALREGDTLARLGGDEFVAVLLDLADADACVPMLTRLLAAAAQPTAVDGATLQVSASLGVTYYPQAEEVDADQLLRQADQAMYQAKLAGKNRYQFFDAERYRNPHDSLGRLRHALSEREFVLHYQPKVNMRTGRVIGAEALIRWQHPERGLLPPAQFLPAIEDHPLAVQVGEWVIDAALSQMAAWRDVGLDLPVSVNVSAHQLQQEDFVGRLREILAAHPNLRPNDLELEVLETSALEDMARVSQVIEDCREIGVNFSLDDFGTGYSSLTYLKHLKVTQLKIDQSFVRDMLGDPEDLAILDGVIGLAAAFRRQVIAEGVETVEHGAMLLQLGCELAQGYGIARPMPARMLSGWADAWRTDPSWAGLSPVSREELPLVFASVEHRAWIAALENRLRGEPEALPPLDPHQCRFGIWLDTGGLVRYGAQPVFKAIESLHRRVHALAVDLLELQACGRNPEALARLSELHGLRDALLEQLKILCGKYRILIDQNPGSEN